MEALRRAKRIQKGLVTRLETRWTRLLQVGISPGQCAQLSQQASEVVQGVSELLQQLIGTIGDDDEEFEQSEMELLDLHDRVRDIQGYIADSLASLSTSEEQERKPEAHLTSSAVKLPPIELPVFEGNLAEWQTFREMFMTVIQDNTKLKDVERLHYLRSCLRGTALGLIKGIPTTSEGYAMAWDLLMQRFDNHRETVYTQLERLFQQPAITGESASSLRGLVDTTREILSALNILKQPVDSWNTILVWMLTRKLDAESAQAWELSLVSKELPRLEDFLRFLEGRAIALMSTTLSKKPLPGIGKPKSVAGGRTTTFAHSITAAASNLKDEHQELCRLCCESHGLHRCAQFIAMSVSQR